MEGRDRQTDVCLSLWVPKIPFRLQISQFGLSDQNFGTPHPLAATCRAVA
jgi:hypothetical protein